MDGKIKFTKKKEKFKKKKKKDETSKKLSIVRKSKIQIVLINTVRSDVISMIKLFQRDWKGNKVTSRQTKGTSAKRNFFRDWNIQEEEIPSRSCKRERQFNVQSQSIVSPFLMVLPLDFNFVSTTISICHRAPFGKTF